MRAGKLNRQITIEQFTDSQDSNGNITKSWSTFKQVWANIQPVRGREYFEAKSINTETTVRFRIRYLSGVTEDMRIKDSDGNLYDIQSILHLEHGKREMEIMTIQTNSESA